MTDKDVSIKMVSTQSDGDSKETTELLSLAKYTKTENGYRITYEESEATGFKGCTTSVELFDNNKVTMERRGAAASNLVIELGTKHHCVYGTPYGDFMVGVNANYIKSTLDDNGGRLEFHYVIDVNSSYVGDFELIIDVK